jgi:hypothetical protein
VQIVIWLPKQITPPPYAAFWPKLEGMKASAFFYLVVCFLFWLADARSVLANQKPCTMAEERQAIDEADHLKDWKTLHRSFIRFSHCDAGAIAEGYSDTVGLLLARHWGQIGILAKLAASDNKFESFVLRHIDESLPIEMLKTITDNAKKSCPATETVLCGKMLQRTQDATHAKQKKLRNETGYFPGTRVD